MKFPAVSFRKRYALLWPDQSAGTLYLVPSEIMGTVHAGWECDMYTHTQNLVCSIWAPTSSAERFRVPNIYI
ncbi:hypothetical protein XELAEV_18046793mg [Xenopus laevis]|uniref:Uncharacterized protein n=1 Tax=Xenopus laevis TaxID=8355 RepID=A0A974BUA6_XENLA|nr:hypothetical protein XELAEV_18046793mg [Xenopus laevis]